LPEPVMIVQDLAKRYRLYRRRHQSLKEILVRRSLGEWEDLWALRDVTFEIPRGQFLGIIGHNGSGKTTLLKVLTQILTPDRGSLRVEGRVSSLLELGAGFQPEYTGRENVYLYGSLLGLRRRQIDQHYDQIVEFSELGSFLDYPVKNYSSGMYMRLGFSVAVHLEPDILLVDEVLAVGDASFQQKCYEHLRRLRARGCTIVLVSHDLASVGRFCERAIWLDHGQVVVDDSADRAIQAYLEAMEAATSESRSMADAQKESALGVTFTSVRYLGLDGTEMRSVESGSPLRLEIEYEACTDLTDVGIGVTVFRNDGVRCLDAELRAAHENAAIPAGKGTLLLDFPRFTLQAGQYATAIGVFDQASRRYDRFHDRRYPFTVEGLGSTGSVVRMDYRWTLPTGAVVVNGDD
jgi:ABC-type polysaccharide/polyol phosphate transport system ATPase subunit